MVVGQPFDRSPIGIDISLEPHFAAEKVRQVIFRSGYRHPVVGVIRTHHAHRIRLIDHFLEGGQVEGPEFPFSSADPGAVDASRRGTMGDEMFKGASHAVFLVALHEGCRHVGDQQGVLSVSFLNPSPAGIPGQFKDRGKHLVDAKGAGFPGAGDGHPAYKFRIEGTALGKGVGENGGPVHKNALDAFGAGYDRKTQAGAVADVPTDGIHEGPALAGVRHETEHGPPALSVQGLRKRISRVDEPVLELRAFLFQGHLLQKVLHPPVNIHRGIFPSFSSAAGGKEGRHHQQQNPELFHNPAFFLKNLLWKSS